MQEDAAEPVAETAATAEAPARQSTETIAKAGSSGGPTGDATAAAAAASEQPPEEDAAAAVPQRHQVLVEGFTVPEVRAETMYAGCHGHAAVARRMGVLLAFCVRGADWGRFCGHLYFICFWCRSDCPRGTLSFHKCSERRPNARSPPHGLSSRACAGSRHAHVPAKDEWERVEWDTQLLILSNRLKGAIAPIFPDVDEWESGAHDDCISVFLHRVLTSRHAMAVSHVPQLGRVGRCNLAIG